MPHLDPLADSSDDNAADSLFRDLKAKLGMVPNMYRTLGHAPHVLQAVMAMGQAIRMDLDVKLRELAYLLTVQLHDCHY